MKAAASRNLLLYDYYIKLYLLVLHTYEYVLQHTHSKKKRTIWSEMDPNFRRFNVSTCLAAFSSDQSKSMPPVLTDMMSHTDKGIDELFFSTKLHCHWTSHNLAQYICYYPSSLKTSLQKMKWKMNKNNNKTVNHPPAAAADAAATELPAATWSRNHSGKLLHYYIRQIKHKKHYLKWSDPISAQLCMTIRCNLRRVRTSVHLNHDFQTQNQPIIE